MMRIGQLPLRIVSLFPAAAPQVSPVPSMAIAIAFITLWMDNSNSVSLKSKAMR